MKIIIVGGVAGGASCAARLRRLDERAQILMVERGPYVSYANCGLPYHVGDVIEQESALLVADANTFRNMFAVEVRTGCECIEVLPASKTVKLRDVASGAVTTESYDKLVLAPGAASIRPPLPGIDLPGIFELRTVPDARTIREWVAKGSPFLAGMHRYAGFQTVRPKTRAVVIGGGFIGIETAENLIHRRFDVTLVEMGAQILAPLDAEMARIAEGHLQRHGLHLVLNDGVAGFEPGENGVAEGADEIGRGVSGRHRDPGAGRAARRGAGQGRGPGDRRARRHPRRRADAHQPAGHLCRRRCGRGQGPGHRRMGPGRAGRPGQPAGPHRRRRDRRARLALPRHAGHGDHRLLRRRRGLDGAQREDAAAPGRHRLSRRPTCTRTRTPATTRVPSRSP